MLNTRVVVTQYGGQDVLKVIEEPLRPPGEGELLVKIQSSGVALADILRREGKYPMPPIPPFTPGYDGVGVVEELGEGVVGYSAGDRVAVFFNGIGGYSTYVYAKLDEVVPVPPHVDTVSATAVLLNYVTAYQMLYRIAKVSSGERVLIHGAGGGTGTALLEFGRLMGLEMYGTASSAKHPIVSQFGAVPIDYRNEDFVDVIRRKVPGGIDAVFDSIGGENYSRSLQTLNKNGRFVGYGYTSILEHGHPSDWARDWTALSNMRTTDSGNPVFMYSITALKAERLDWFREDVQHVLSLLADDKIRPIISHRIPLHEVAKAHDLLENSAAIGKVILIHDKHLLM